MKHICQPEKSGQFICYTTGQFYLLLKLVVGAQGGHAAGKAMPDKSLDIPGNTTAGVVGGGLSGQILNTMLGRAAAATADAAASGTEIGAINPADCGWWYRWSHSDDHCRHHQEIHEQELVQLTKEVEMGAP